MPLRSPLCREVAHRPAVPLRRDRARLLHALQRIAEGLAGGEIAPQLFGCEALRVRREEGKNLLAYLTALAALFGLNIE